MKILRRAERNSSTEVTVRANQSERFPYSRNPIKTGWEKCQRRLNKTFIAIEILQGWTEVRREF